MIPITAEYIQDQFKLERKFKGVLTLNRIERIVCMHFKVTTVEVQSHSHRQDIVDCRHVIWFLLYSMGINFREIATIKNRKGHSGIARGVKKVITLLDAKDEKLVNAITEIYYQLNSTKY